MSTKNPVFKAKALQVAVLAVYSTQLVWFAPMAQAASPGPFRGKAAKNAAAAPVAPGAPTLVAGFDSGVSNTDLITYINTPRIEGSCVDGDTISAVLDGALLTPTSSPISAEAVTCAAGRYALALTAPVADGVYQIGARASNVDGESPDSATIQVTVDSTVAAPTVASPSDNAQVGQAFTMSGAAEPNAAINIKDVSSPGQPVLCDTTANTLGNWQCAINLNQVGRTYALALTQQDAAGNLSAAGTINLHVPSAPGAPTIALDSASDSGVAGDGITNVTQPTLRGSCAGASTITLRLLDDVGAVVGSGSSNCASGEYSHRWAAPLAKATYGFQAVGGNSAGGSAPSSIIPVTIDDSALAPTVTSVSEGATMLSTVAIAGSAENGARIQVTGSNGQTCNTIAAGSGTWSCGTMVFAGGNQWVSASQTDVAGNVSVAERTSFVVELAPGAPGAPTLDGSADTGVMGDNITRLTTLSFSGVCSGRTAMLIIGGQPNGASVTCDSGSYRLANSTPLTPGVHSVAVRTGNISGSSDSAATLITVKTHVAAPQIVSPADNAVIAEGAVTIRGTGEPGARVAVNTSGSTGNRTACVNVPVDAQGLWNCSVDMPAGTSSITATQTDVAANVSAASGAARVLVPARPGELSAPVLAAASDSGVVGDNVTRVTTPLFTGACSNGDTMSLVLDGQVLTQMATCANNTYSLAVTRPLGAGQYMFAARANNASGTTTSPAVAVRIKTSVAAPIVVAPSAGASVVPGSLAIIGTGDPGAEVSVAAGAATVCTTRVDANGNWNCEGQFAAGNYTLRASQVDYAGNQSAAGASQALSVDAGTPSTVTIVRGNNQAAYIGNTFSEPIEVEVRTTRGLPAAGVALVLNVPGTGASARLAPDVGVTDAQGRFRTVASANTLPGSYIINVRIIGTVTNTGNPAASVPTLRLANQVAEGVDSDGDGVPDTVEIVEGTDPLAKDNAVMTSDVAFIKQQYRDFLGREADANGVAFWSGQMRAGVKRSDMVMALLNSQEFSSTVAPVVRLYGAYFGRQPDLDGLNYWAGEYRRSGRLESISSAFAGSSEFAATYGSVSDRAFVELVYRNVLGRAGDEAGIAAWTAELANKRITRGQVMVAFSESAENRARSESTVTVTMVYLGLARRAPDAQGLAFWAESLARGRTTTQAFVDSFITSTEYAKRFTN